jgi:SAM-dependent methyltransferase
MVPNDYSATWFNLFLRPIPAEQTGREIAFLTRQLPRPAFSSILDLCCGEGRHAVALAQLGYEIIGVDREHAALVCARRACPFARFVCADMRDIAAIDRTFDGVIILWQSFGYFDAAANVRLLGDIAGRLTSRGRLVLDLYHPDFFRAHQQPRTFEISGMSVTEEKRVIDDRLTVTLHYAHDENARGSDVFSWELFQPAQLAYEASRFGLAHVVTCAAHDERTPASADRPRYQIVFERNA